MSTWSQDTEPLSPFLLRTTSSLDYAGPKLELLVNLIECFHLENKKVKIIYSETLDFMLLPKGRGRVPGCLSEGCRDLLSSGCPMSVSPLFFPLRLLSSTFFPVFRTVIFSLSPISLSPCLSSFSSFSFLPFYSPFLISLFPYF